MYKFKKFIPTAILVLSSSLAMAQEQVKHQWPDGSVYEGQWANGQPEGTGTLKLTSGAQYRGHFVSGFPHGKGEYLYANGDVYNGQWENGQHHGQGLMRYKDGTVYQGRFVYGRREGKGKLTMVTGLAFEGSFVQGRAHGTGMCSKKGKTSPCEFRNDRLVESDQLPTQDTRTVASPITENFARVAILDAGKITPDQLEGRAKKAPGSKSLADLEKSRSDLYFVLKGLDENLFDPQPIAWWQKRTALSGQILDLWSVHGDTVIHLVVKQYDGPGDYKIDQVDIDSKLKPFRKATSATGTITVDQDQEGWVSGYFQLTLEQKKSKPIRFDHGVFRVNNERPSPSH